YTPVPGLAGAASGRVSTSGAGSPLRSWSVTDTPAVRVRYRPDPGWGTGCPAGAWRPGSRRPVAAAAPPRALPAGTGWVRAAVLRARSRCPGRHRRLRLRPAAVGRPVPQHVRGRTAPAAID